MGCVTERGKPVRNVNWVRGNRGLLVLRTKLPSDSHQASGATLRQLALTMGGWISTRASDVLSMMRGSVFDSLHFASDAAN